MRFRTLRHSAATLLMAEGVLVKVASELLDHADITTTLRIYSHVLPSMQEQAADDSRHRISYSGMASSNPFSARWRSVRPA